MGDINREDEIIGANLKRFRRVYGISRKKMAEIFHISEDGVYRIERGETGLSSTYAFILAKELHCDMNFIYGTTSEPMVINSGQVEHQPLTQNGIAQRLRIYAELLDEIAEGDK